MADTPDTASLASALYPDLPSAGAPAAPAPPAGRGGGERSTAEKIFGTDPGNGLTKARASIASGVAKPAAEPAPAPSERPPPGDWLAEVARDQREADARDAPEPAVEVAAPGHLVEEFNTMAHAAGLDSAGSEKMLQLHQKALAETSAQYWDQQGVAWEKASKARFGSQLPSMVRAVQPLLNDARLTPPAFRALLDQYRIGSHPVVIDTLNRWARAMGRRR